MYLIAYDISKDRLRNKVAKTLEGYGKRVQYSVFECNLDRKKYKEMYGKMVELLSDAEEANLRIYTLDRDAEKRTVIIGDSSFVGSRQEDEDVIFI